MGGYKVITFNLLSVVSKSYYKCQLSVKFLGFCQLSVIFWPFVSCQLTPSRPSCSLVVVTPVCYPTFVLDCSLGKNELFAFIVRFFTLIPL